MTEERSSEDQTGKISDDPVPLREQSRVMKYLCLACSYSFNTELGDEDRGVPSETKLEDLPDDFICPFCEAGKDSFEEVGFLEE